MGEKNKEKTLNGQRRKRDEWRRERKEERAKKGERLKTQDDIKITGRDGK